MNQEDKRDARKKQTAEIFTPPWLVEQMLDKLPQETWEQHKTFLDPACGNGNFLVAVLARKLQAGHDPLVALGNTYGADIMLDNVEECRTRLLGMVEAHTEDHRRAVAKNIKWVDPAVYPRGSLDYDFHFDNV